MNGQTKLRDELRIKYPGKARDARRQRGEAIRLYCIECVGGSQHLVRGCETKDCFLWPFRAPGKPHCATESGAKAPHIQSVTR